MLYDLLAFLYEKADDKKCRYCVPLGFVGYSALEGFSEDPDSTDGYTDYILRNAQYDDLVRLVQWPYENELNDVYSSDKLFERIEIRASELDVLDDDGTIGARGVTISEVFVQFEETAPSSPVVFYNAVFENIKKNTKRFKVPLKKLKNYFGVLTMFEVMERLDKYFGKGLPWTFEQLKKYFKDDLDAKRLAVKNIEIAKKVIGGDEYLNLKLEPNYKGYEVVVCEPKGDGILGLPFYVLIKNGKGHIADIEERDELLFRPLNAKDYKKAVKNYMIIQLGVSEEVAENSIRKNDATLDDCWKDKLSVPAAATGLLHNFL